MSQALQTQPVRTELGWWPSLPEGWRDTPEYSRWRVEVWRRHGSRCKGCGSFENLEAHHVYPASTCEGQPGYPHLVYDPSNGVLACRACHIRIDPWLFHCLLTNRLKEADRAKLAARTRPGRLRRIWSTGGVDEHKRHGTRKERARQLVWHHLWRDPFVFAAWVFCAMAVWGLLVVKLYANYPTDTPAQALSWFAWQALWSGLGGLVALVGLVLFWRRAVRPFRRWLLTQIGHGLRYLWRRIISLSAECRRVESEVPREGGKSDRPGDAEAGEGRAR